MRARRVALALMVATAAAAGWDRVAAAQTTTTEAPFRVEAWYQPNPFCATPFGCESISPPPSNPHGEGTLHVAASAGQEAARAYLGLGAISPPRDAELSRALLSIPVDESTPGNGSSDPQTATLQVCVAVEEIEAVEGSFADPPRIDCEGAVRMTFSDAPAPTFTAHIASLLTEWAAEMKAGTLSLAIVPTLPSESSSWRVVFSSHDRAEPPTPPASLALAYAAASSGTSTSTAADSGSVSFSAPPARATLGDTSTLFAPPPLAATPITATEGSAPPPATDFFTAPETIPFQYPAAVFLPAALLGLGVLIVRVMTVDVTLSTRPDGAGSPARSRRPSRLRRLRAVHPLPADHQ